MEATAEHIERIERVVQVWGLEMADVWEWQRMVWTWRPWKRYPTRKGILAELATYIDELREWGYPPVCSLAHLAERTGSSTRTVVASIDMAIREGLLSCKPATGDVRRWIFLRPIAGCTLDKERVT